MKLVEISMILLSLFSLAASLTATTSLVLIRCSEASEKSSHKDPSEPSPDPIESPDPDPTPIPDETVNILKYLESFPSNVSVGWRRNHKLYVEIEGYLVSEMPFEEGYLEKGTENTNCKVFPIGIFEKKDENTVCRVRIKHDCNGNYISHTSECLVL